MWIKIEGTNNLPPENKEVLFRTAKGRAYVGILHKYGSTLTYKIITARGSTLTGLKPIEWTDIPE